MSVIEGPEKVWQGLTDPAFTTRHWRHPAPGGFTYVSDWQKGPTCGVADKEAVLVVSDPEQLTLEPDPCRRLAYARHTFMLEWRLRPRHCQRLAGRAPFSRSPSASRRSGRARPKLIVVASLTTLVETGSALPSA